MNPFNFKTILFIFLVVPSFLLLSSCGKEEVPPTETDPNASKAVALHNNSKKLWLLESETLNGTDVTSLYEECELDNIYIYDNLDNFIVDAGDAKCGTEADEVRFKYVAKEEHKYIEISNNDSSLVQEVVELSSNKLSLKHTDAEDVIIRNYVPY